MISRVEYENFLSIEHIILEDLQDKRLIGITGKYKNKEGYSNGTGKTSIAEGIGWIFTGEHRFKTDYEIIRIGQESCRVNITLNDKYGELFIERIVKKRKNLNSTLSTMIVKLNGEIKANSVKEGQKYIENFLGITPRDFLYSFFFQQKKFQKFLQDKTSDKIAFLQEFFGADIFDRAKDLSSKERKELKTKLDIVRGRIEDLEEKTKGSDKNMNQLEASKMSLEKKKKELDKDYSLNIRKIETLNKEITEKKIEVEKNIIEKKNKKELEKEYQEIKKRGLELKSNIEKSEALIKEIKDSNEIKSNQCSKIKKDLEIQWNAEEDKKLNSLKDKSDRIILDIEVSKTNLKNIEEQIKHIKLNTCYVCDTEITEQKRTVLEKDKNKAKAEIESSIIIKEKELSDINNLIKDMKTKQNLYLKNKEKLENILREIEKNKHIVKGKEDLLSSLKEERDALKTKYTRTGEKIKAIVIKDDDLEELIEDINGELRDLGVSNRYLLGELKTLNSELASVITRIEYMLEDKDRLKSLLKEEKKLTDNIADRVVLEEVFEKCKMELISYGLEELDEISNNIISQIGATSKEIDFELFKENQKKEVLDGLEIYLTDEKGKRSIVGLSGGEFDSVSFAVRASLARYKLLRMNSKIDFMILDEIFSALDEVSREEIIAVINFFKEDFYQIFSISHTSLKNSFENNIHLEMDGKGITRLKEIS
jgi:DNA repair exonuclease SbcCD ATPase subunit